MSSFYGRVLYQFTRLFSKISIKNAGFSVENAPPSTAFPEESFQAHESWDTIEFQTGNRWIDLKGDDTHNRITLYHSAPGAAVATNALTGMTNIAAAALPKDATLIELDSGAIIETTNSNFDAAGHLTGEVTHKFYKLPPPVINLNGTEDNDLTTQDDNKLHFYGDTWLTLEPGVDDDNKAILAFTHTIPEVDDADSTQIKVSTFGVISETDIPEGETPYQLLAGDTFIKHDMVKDSQGHIISDTMSYMKLPITETDAKLEEYDEQLETIDGRLGGQIQLDTEGNIILDPATNNPKAPDSRYASYENIRDGLVSLKDDDVGELTDNVYSVTSNQKTLAETIGLVDGTNGFSAKIASLKGENTNTIYSISDGLRALSTYSVDSNNEIKGLAARFTLLLTALKDAGVIDVSGI